MRGGQCFVPPPIMNGDLPWKLGMSFPQLKRLWPLRLHRRKQSLEEQLCPSRADGLT